MLVLMLGYLADKTVLFAMHGSGWGNEAYGSSNDRMRTCVPAACLFFYITLRCGVSHTRIQGSTYWHIVKFHCVRMLITCVLFFSYDLSTSALQMSLVIPGSGLIFLMAHQSPHS